MKLARAAWRALRKAERSIESMEDEPGDWGILLQRAFDDAKEARAEIADFINRATKAFGVYPGKPK
jgi:hypothetical protein